MPATDKPTLRISQRIGPAAEREIRLGDSVAYGEIARDGRTYTLLHAPTQDDFNAVADALDSLSAAEIRAAIKTP